PRPELLDVRFHRNRRRRRRIVLADDAIAGVLQRPPQRLFDHLHDRAAFGQQDVAQRLAEPAAFSRDRGRGDLGIFELGLVHYRRDVGLPRVDLESASIGDAIDPDERPRGRIRARFGGNVDDPARRGTACSNEEAGEKRDDKDEFPHRRIPPATRLQRRIRQTDEDCDRRWRGYGRAGATTPRRHRPHAPTIAAAAGTAGPHRPWTPPPRAPRTPNPNVPT